MSRLNYYHNLLHEHPLFSHLSKEKIDQIIQIGKEITLKRGEYLFHENDVATNFFLITEGSLDVIKSDRSQKNSYSITHLTAGDMIGEMALIDLGARSASAKADTETRVLEISINNLQNLAEHDTSFNAILLKIAKNLTARLRTTNESIVHSLGLQLEEYKTRVSMGSFMVNIIVALCLFNWFTSGAPYLTSLVSNSTGLTIPLTLVFFILVYFDIKSSPLPMSTFGLTLQNWRKSIFEALMFTSVLLLILLLIKLLIIKLFPGVLGEVLFEPYALIQPSPALHLSKKEMWLITLILYWLLVVPMQELIARGGLQGSLEIFLTGKHRALKAIIISNLMFATTHLFLSFGVSLIVFCAGLYFGWLYNRHHSLVGVILAHGMLGTWMLWIVF